MFCRHMLQNFTWFTFSVSNDVFAYLLQLMEFHPASMYPTLPLGYHFGYRMWKISKNRFFTTQKFDIMVPKMVPQWYPKCLMVPQLLYTLYKINFHDFSSSKNGHITTLGTILGNIPNFWVPSIIVLENIPCQLFKKKNVLNISRYLLT